MTEFDLQDLLGILQLDALEVGDGVGGLQRIFQRGDRGDQFLREGGDHLRDLLELVARHCAPARRSPTPLRRVSGELDVRLEVGFLRHELAQLEAVIPCTSRRTVPSGARSRRWTVAIVPTWYRSAGAGRFQLGVDGGHQPHQLVAADHVIDQLDRARLPNRERHGGVGIDHDPAQGQDRQDVRIFGRIFAPDSALEPLSFLGMCENMAGISIANSSSSASPIH